MSRPLRLGLAGIRHYHANFWAEAIATRPGAGVALVWDADAEAAAAFCARHGLARADTLEQLLAGVDGVAIASETSAHRALIEAACAARLPILCEKPLSTDQADSLAVAQAIRASGVLFQQSFPKRLDPATLEVQRILALGVLGRVHLARVRHGHGHGLDPGFLKGWYADPALSGGGTLLDEGIHAADLLNLLFGLPESVVATIAAPAGQAVEDAAQATFLYAPGHKAAGLIAEVATGWRFAAADASVEIYGDAGTLLLSGVDLASKTTRSNGHLRLFTRDGGWQDLPVVPAFVSGWFHHLVALSFVDVLEGRRSPPSGLDEALAAAAMIEAAYHSARTGRRVAVPVPGAVPVTVPLTMAVTMAVPGASDLAEPLACKTGGSDARSQTS